MRAAVAYALALAAVAACGPHRPLIRCVDTHGVADKSKCETCYADPMSCRSGCDVSIGVCVYPRATGAPCTNPGQCAAQGCFRGKCQ